MKKSTFIGIAIILILLSLTWVLFTPILLPETQADASITAPHQGFQAPEFTLQTPQGETVSLSDYRGRPVLVFMWASWCSVCMRIMPGLESIHQDYAANGFEILAVNTTFQDTLPTAIDYFQSQDYTYTMLLDMDGAVSRTYRTYALPTSLLISPDGIVQDVMIGSGLSEGLLRAWLDSILSAEL